MREIPDVLDPIFSDLEYTLDQGDEETWTQTDWMNWSAATEPNKLRILMTELKAARADRRDEFAKVALGSAIMVCTGDTTRTGSYEEHCAKIAYSFADAMMRAREDWFLDDRLTAFRDKLKTKASKDGFLAIEDIESVYDAILRVPGE